MRDDEHARKAAGVIADLLTSTLAQGERDGRHLYCWEQRGIEWLREQWKRDPETMMNMWTADRYVLNTNLDLDAKLSTARKP